MIYYCQYRLYCKHTNVIYISESFFLYLFVIVNKNQIAIKQPQYMPVKVSNYIQSLYYSLLCRCHRLSIIEFVYFHAYLLASYHSIYTLAITYVISSGRNDQGD